MGGGADGCATAPSGNETRRPAMGEGARAALGAFDYLIRNEFDDKDKAA